MSDLDRNYASPFGRAAGRADAATVDAGLRAYMLRIYNYMTIGLAITGLAALGVYMAGGDDRSVGAAAKIGNALLTPFGYAMFVSPLKWLFMLAPLAMVFAISAGINRLRPATAQMLFWVFSALMGVSLSSIFLVYTHTSIVRVFFITAASFGALSLFGYTTKRDMTGMGSFLLMGLFGIIIASLVNIFVASSALQFVVSVVGVLVFAGLTAWDTQRLKNDYIYGYASQGGDVAERAAISGALSLYLNFINLFTLLLQLLGQRDYRPSAPGGNNSSPGLKAGAFLLSKAKIICRHVHSRNQARDRGRSSLRHRDLRSRGALSAPRRSNSIRPISPR